MEFVFFKSDLVVPVCRIFFLMLAVRYVMKLILQHKQRFNRYGVDIIKSDQLRRSIIFVHPETMVGRYREW